MRFKKVTIGGHSRVIDLARAASTLISGNFQSYRPGSSAYSAYTGMWGVFITPQNDHLQATSSMRVTAGFPAKTTFNWNVVPDPNWGGLNGYLHVDYGNYDSSPGSITPQQVYALTACSLNVGWTFAGDAASGLLSELWLSSASAASGALTKVYEIGFLPKMSAASLTFATGIPAVGSGSFTSGGVTWNVGSTTNSTSQPYYVAFRADHADHQGVLPFYDLLIFLTNAGAITGNEWVNGIAFGVEPFTGVGSLLISSLSGTVTGAARVPWTITDATGIPQSGGTSVQLSWKPAPGATGHEVQVNGTGSWITVVGSMSTVNMSALTPSTAYTFNVRGINATGNGAGSNTVSVTTLGAAVSNLTTNGDFSAGATGWTGVSGTKSIVSGACVFSGTSAFDGITQTGYTYTVGKYYEVQFTISSRTAGTMQARLMGGTDSQGTNRSANGTYTERLQALSGNNGFVLYSTTAGSSFTVDNISVIGPYNTSTVGGA